MSRSARWAAPALLALAGPGLLACGPTAAVPSGAVPTAAVPTASAADSGPGPSRGPLGAVEVAGCDTRGRSVTALDHPGPGRVTPQRAVRPFADGLGLRVVPDGARAYVLATRPDGSPARLFEVSEGDDGWWVDGWAVCTPSAPLAPSAP